MNMNRLMALIFATWIAGVPVQAQLITHHYPLFMPAMAKPAAGSTYTDPVFGTTVKRLTNALAAGSLGIAPQYSKRQAWNANDSLMLLLNCDDGYFSLYNGQTGQFIRPLDDPAVGGEDVFWHPTDKYRIIYAFDSILYSYDIRTSQRTTLHVFTAYTWINTRGEGNLSNDGRYYAFIGQNYNYSTGEVTFTDIVVYDINTNQIISQMPVYTGPAAGYIDWMSVSPSGNYVIIDHSDTDSARHHGVEVYDRNLNFIWQRPADAGHSDLGYDNAGQEVILKDVYDPDSNIYHIFKYRLSDGARTTLLSLSVNFDLHISCRNTARPGYCFISTFDCPYRLTDDSLSWLPFEDELFALKMDGSGYTERIAHHHSRRYSPSTPDPDNSVYWAEPHATVNRAGTKALWGSNWRQNVGLVTSVDTYLCDFSAFVGIPSQVTITNVTVGAGQSRCYNATQAITVAGNGATFQISQGGAATFISGGNILFKPGVLIMQGGTMDARITTMSLYCNTSAPENASSPNNANGEPGTDWTEKESCLTNPRSHASVYPNPSTGNIIIRAGAFAEDSLSELLLFDPIGRFIRKAKVSGNEVLFSLDGLPSGMYTIRIIRSSGVQQERVMKKPSGF